tara:strand:+ start:1362 stop:1490 length:129 start_codon:yes stop_codon:yes gene_type:complete
MVETAGCTAEDLTLPIKHPLTNVWSVIIAITMAMDVSWQFGL